MIARGVLALMAFATVASFGLPDSGDDANCTNSCHCDCSAAPPEPSPLLGAAAPQAQGFCKNCVFVSARYFSEPYCNENRDVDDSVDRLISSQWDNDKRMFYVDTKELQVDDPCSGTKKHLTIVYSIDGHITSSYGWEKETIDFRQICCTRNPVAPPARPPPSPRPRPPFA